MKKILLIFIFLILFSGFVLSSYVCNDGSNVVQDKEEIDEFDKKVVNNLGMAVIEAREHAVLMKVEVELVINAEKLTITNATSPDTIKLSDKEYEISLINATDNNAKVQIETTSKEIDERDYRTINNLLVYLVESYGPDSGEEKAEMIIGVEKVDLDSVEKPSQIVNVDNVKYGIELFSASDTQAIILVSKCKTGTLEEAEEDISVETEEEPVEGKIEQIEEESSEVQKNIEGEQVEVQEKDKKSILSNQWLWVILVFVILIIAYVVFNRK